MPTRKTTPKKRNGVALAARMRHAGAMTSRRDKRAKEPKDWEEIDNPSPEDVVPEEDQEDE